MPRLSVAALLILALASSASAGERALTADDLLALATVRDPQISPDGHWVAYTVATIDLEEDESETALWAVPVAGGEPWRMTAPGYSASRPRWSPDGRRLGFLSSRSTDEDEAKTQVWAFDLRGGDAQPLSDVVQGVDTFDWSPDGSRLLLGIQDPKPEDLLDEAEKAKKKPEPHVIDRLQFKRDYTGYLDRRRTHLYVLDLADERLTQITSGDHDDADGAWSPDGKLVAFTSNRTAEPDGNDNSDLWIVAAANTDQGRTLRQVTDNPGGDHSPAWSPDGKSLAYVTDRAPELMWYATQQLALISVAGGESRLLAPDLDRNVGDPRFTPDGKSVLFSLEDSGAQHLARIALAGGAVDRTVGGDRAVLGYSQSAAGDLAVLASEPQLPAEVFHVKGGALRQLTDTNRELLDQLALGRVETIHFASADGTEIEGFVTFPPGYDSHLTYPGILWIHGGPTSQYDASFHQESQLFAANGYVVIRVNPRGSTGYGQDFCRAIFADWGNLDFQDVMAGVDYAIAQGWVDAAKLGVGGWSYGGILTNYVITQSDRFAAAISGASEALYVANYGHDHYQLAWEQELGLPWENRELWERLSPFNRVEKIVTPTLFMGGAEDWNVPVLNSEQLYQALKRLGRTTQLVVYPGEHHGISKPSFRQDRWQRYLAWYERYVKGIEPALAVAE
jgi:dipeptidyl aminopeptidase/acylaminoacyl peptidase